MHVIGSGTRLCQLLANNVQILTKRETIVRKMDSEKREVEERLKKVPVSLNK